MLRQIKWRPQNGPIKKNGVLPATTLFYWIFCFSRRTSYKELICCTSNPNAHICPFCKRWSFIWRCFFPVSILKKMLHGVSDEFWKSLTKHTQIFSLGLRSRFGRSSIWLSFSAAFKFVDGTCLRKFPPTAKHIWGSKTTESQYTLFFMKLFHWLPLNSSRVGSLKTKNFNSN